MFSASLFTIAKMWKQPKCQSMASWIKDMLYSMHTYAHRHRHTMEYYIVSRKREVLPFVCDNTDGP